MLPYPDIQTYLLSPQLRGLSLDLKGGLAILHPHRNFSDFFTGCHSHACATLDFNVLGSNRVMNISSLCERPSVLHPLKTLVFSLAKSNYVSEERTRG